MSNNKYKIGQIVGIVAGVIIGSVAVNMLFSPFKRPVQPPPGHNDYNNNQFNPKKTYGNPNNMI